MIINNLLQFAFLYRVSCCTPAHVELTRVWYGCIGLCQDFPASLAEPSP